MSIKQSIVVWDGHSTLISFGRASVMLLSRRKLVAVLLLSPIFPTSGFTIAHQTFSHPSAMSMSAMEEGASATSFTIDEASRESNRMYITIGPQCAGKTTLLKDIDADILDIALDDQQGVYLPLDVNDWLEVSSRSLERRYIGKTLRQRLMAEEQMELRATLLRFAGYITKGEFQARIQTIYQTFTLKELQKRDPDITQIPQDFEGGDDHVTIANAFIQTVESIVQTSKQQLPPKVELFCVEALFRENPRTNMTAIDTASNLCFRNARDSSVKSLSWGNTNAKPRDYKVALEAAQQSGRSVHFLVYDTTAGRVHFDQAMPQLEFEELLRRNLNRMLKSGKYVPAKAIWDTSTRVHNLCDMSVKQLDRQVPEDDGGDQAVHSQLAFDQCLARFCNFQMDQDRKVTFLGPPTKKRSRSPRNNNRQKTPNGNNRQNGDTRHGANNRRYDSRNNNGRGGRGNRKVDDQGRVFRGNRPQPADHSDRSQGYRGDRPQLGGRGRGRDGYSQQQRNGGRSTWPRTNGGNNGQTPEVMQWRPLSENDWQQPRQSQNQWYPDQNRDYYHGR